MKSSVFWCAKMSEAEEMQYAPKDWMITRHIPYAVRWKLLQMKLMLNDIRELAEKHQIESANKLYVQMCREIDAYLNELTLKLFEVSEE